MVSLRGMSRLCRTIVRVGRWSIVDEPGGNVDTCMRDTCNGERCNAVVGVMSWW